MGDLSLPVILGTARPGRRSAVVADHVVDAVKGRGILTDLVDVADFRLTGTGTEGAGRPVDAYREIITGATGLVVVAPEYNHGYPGELKLLLDSEFRAYHRKPVGLVAVSNGRLGGARMSGQLVQVFAALGMIPVAPVVHVPMVADAFDAAGELLVPGLGESVGRMLDEIEWHMGNRS